MQDIMKLVALLLAATTPSTAITVKQHEPTKWGSWSKSADPVKEQDMPEKPASLEEGEEDLAVADSWSVDEDCKSICSPKCLACGALCDPGSPTVDIAACRTCIEVPECRTCVQCHKEQSMPEKPASLEEGEEDPAVADSWSADEDCKSMCSPKCLACGALCDPGSPTVDIAACRTCIEVPECRTCLQCHKEQSMPEKPASLEEGEEDLAVADSWSVDEDCKSICPPKCLACGALCDPGSPTVDIAACRTCIEVPECRTCVQCHKEQSMPEKPASLEEGEEDPAVADSWSADEDCKSMCSPKCLACGALCDPGSPTVDIAACRTCIEVPECRTCLQCHKEQDMPEKSALA